MSTPEFIENRRPSVANRWLGGVARLAYNTLYPPETGGYDHTTGATTPLQQRLANLAGITIDQR